jgi:hypothetical protein
MGAIVGTGLGAANTQNPAGYLQQQYNGTTRNAWRRGHICHRDITERCRVLRKLRAILPTPSKLFLERIAQFRVTPCAEWNGVWSLVEK